MYLYTWHLRTGAVTQWLLTEEEDGERKEGGGGGRVFDHQCLLSVRQPSSPPSCHTLTHTFASLTHSPEGWRPPPRGQGEGGGQMGSDKSC